LTRKFNSIDAALRFLRSAAHKAASPAGESPAMVNDDEPSSHNRLGLVGDPAQASSVVKVLTGAGQARLQAAP